LYYLILKILLLINKYIFHIFYFILTPPILFNNNISVNLSGEKVISLLKDVYFVTYIKQFCNLFLVQHLEDNILLTEIHSNEIKIFNQYI